MTSALLVASVGGHLTQMIQLLDRVEPKFEKVVWVTSSGPQADVLSRSFCVEEVRAVTPRNLWAALRLLPSAWRIVGEQRPDVVVSTGAAIALPFIVVARLRRTKAVYIESATRLQGPSLTGRLLCMVPGVRRLAQHSWPDRRRWTYLGSVFDSYEAVPCEPTDAALTAVVTVGTQDYGFRRLLERLVEIIPESWSVTWQVGATPVDGLAIEVRRWVPADEMSDLLGAADVVVCHAGTGSALSSLDAGRLPVLVPRERQAGEHVDDHQWQTAGYLEHRGLAIVADVDTLTYETLLEAACWSIKRTPAAPIVLFEGPQV
jgi:UDP-N-acetylglucosamine--N-acetylmuramyl-(pentapeptide) pyrophosphoryl-undecaprenol N-acetylglucosamine transferase